VRGNAFNANDSNNNGGAVYNPAGGFNTADSQMCQSTAENGGGYYGGSGSDGRH
jgi:hypothetical protein